MKGKSIALLAVAATLLMQASPGLAANPASPYSSGERATWPKWYYYDQVGLRMWLKGDRNAALNMFDQSYKMAENQLQGKKPLDNRTKSMVHDVVNHQLFHMGEWRKATDAQARSVTPAELAAKVGTVTKNERERELRWLERLEAFAKRNLGAKHLDVQALEKHRYFLQPPDPKEYDEQDMVNTQGRANHGTVVRPSWYQTNERDFTPELFTRNPRKVHQEGTEDQKRMDVTKRPTEQVTKGFSWSGGKKIDMSKPVKTNEKGWAANSSVGSIEVNNPNMKPAGWGADNKDTNFGAAKTKDQTQWGIGAQNINTGGKRGNKSSWGTNPDDQDSVFNKPWGGAGQSNTSDQQQNTDNR